MLSFFWEQKKASISDVSVTRNVVSLQDGGIHIVSLELKFIFIATHFQLCFGTKVCKVNWCQCRHKDHLILLPRTYIVYGSHFTFSWELLDQKESENVWKHSWRWLDCSCKSAPWLNSLQVAALGVGCVVQFAVLGCTCSGTVLSCDTKPTLNTTEINMPNGSCDCLFTI